MITIEKLIDLTKKIIDNDASSPPCGDLYYEFLTVVMKEFGLKIAVECGVAGGNATKRMILSSEDSFVIGINLGIQSQCLEMYEHYPHNVVFLDMDTTTAGNKVFEVLDGRTIDLLFLDSTHDGITPTKEFNQFQSMLSDIALVCCDDILVPEMKKFWEWLPGEKVELNNLHNQAWAAGFGVSIVRR